MPVAQKRAGRATAQPPKRAKKDPARAQVEKALTVVTDALSEVAIDGPKTNRKMLLTCVPGALGMGASKDERDKYQQVFVHAIGEVLKADQKKAEEAVATAQVEVDTASAAKEACDAAVTDAQEKLDAKKLDIKTKKEDVFNDTRATKEAEKLLASSKNEVDNFDDIQKQKAVERDQCQAALSESLEAVKKGAWESKTEKRKGEAVHFAAITEALSCAEAEKSLLRCFAAALELAPDSRGSFDQAVIQSVEKRISSHVANLSQGLADGPGLKSQKEAAVTAAQAALESAEEKKKVSVELLQAAEQERPGFEEALKSAASSVKDSKKALEKKEEALEEEQAKAEHSADNLASFTFLCERPAVAPEPETAAEDPAAEAADDIAA